MNQTNPKNPMTTRIATDSDKKSWDAYVHAHAQCSVYHLFAWRNIIEKTYGHLTFYLIALKNPTNPVVGILPLVHLKHFFFGNRLISIPFFDMGGILADDIEVEKALLSEAVEIANKLKTKNIELRHTQPLACLDSFSSVQLTRNTQHATRNWVFRLAHTKFACFLNSLTPQKH